VDESLQHLCLTPVKKTIFDDQTRVWLSSLTENFPVSASSLNTYLEDPKLFFERYILKVPEATQPHLAFGTAIHAALEFLYRYYMEHDHTYPELQSVLSVFDHILSSQTLTPSDLESRLRQGHATLATYVSEKRTDFPQVIALEESFGWKRGKVFLGDIELTGKIDRIDAVATEKKQVRVIDYKTGKPKTIGDIEGTTKASKLSTRELALPENLRGRLKRQLLFYKLLLSLDSKYSQYSLQEGIFEFVEPVHGSFISRTIILTEKDTNDLKQLITEVSAEIRSLAFLELL
jgi:DNA helicase-2/ATP-dependent DNA helicase PcrA